MLRTLAVAAFVGLLSACSPATEEPSAEPAFDEDVLRDVSVDWENRTEDTYTVTLAQNGTLVATGHVLPCEAAGFGIQMAGPFSIGLTSGGGPGVSKPGAEIADSTGWPAADGFVVVVIAPDGAVTVEKRDERVTPAEGICP